VPTLEARGVELAWTERGEGAPVLLIHETATTGSVWDPVAEALAASARTITYDRRGWGSSTAPDEYLRTTVEEQSEDAAALIESIGGPVVVGGAGAGAVVALDLLLRRPDLVVAALLVEPLVLQLLPTATEALSDDRRRLAEGAADRAGMVEFYLSGGLSALGPGVARLPEQATAGARSRQGSVIAELGMTSGWTMPLPRFGQAERPSITVTGPSTPPMLRDAAAALGSRLAASSEREVESDGEPPHLGAASEVAAMILELSP
jgi:pimeloyl-ACP methyl ester carboxylesterase